ncbi:hypothetical protein C8Q78DRAFT_994438 [Trametes maxima]|nr:hypothetical protein C8Q78DRAFT_994438 [Trametes maxima]
MPSPPRLASLDAFPPGQRIGSAAPRPGRAIATLCDADSGALDACAYVPPGLWPAPVARSVRERPRAVRPLPQDARDDPALREAHAMSTEHRAPSTKNRAPSVALALRRSKPRSGIALALLAKQAGVGGGRSVGPTAAAARPALPARMDVAGSHLPPAVCRLVAVVHRDPPPSAFCILGGSAPAARERKRLENVCGSPYPALPCPPPAQRTHRAGACATVLRGTEVAAWRVSLRLGAACGLRLAARVRGFSGVLAFAVSRCRGALAGSCAPGVGGLSRAAVRRASGVGRWALGTGHWTLGIGHWVSRATDRRVRGSGRSRCAHATRGGHGRGGDGNMTGWVRSYGTPPGSARP